MVPTLTRVLLTPGAELRLSETLRGARLEEVDVTSGEVRVVAIGVHRRQLLSPARVWVETHGAEWAPIAAAFGWDSPGQFDAETIAAALLARRPPAKAQALEGAREMHGEIGCVHGIARNRTCSACERALPPEFRRRRRAR